MRLAQCKPLTLRHGIQASQTDVCITEVGLRQGPCLPWMHVCDYDPERACKLDAMVLATTVKQTGHVLAYNPG